MSRRSPLASTPEPQLRRSSRRRRRRMAGWPERILLAAIAVLAAAFIYSLIPHNSSPKAVSGPPQVPSIGALQAQGRRVRGAFLTNEAIKLSWTASPRADQYRLQVAIAPLKRQNAQETFHHPVLSMQWAQTSYTVRLGSPGLYLWRVQAADRGLWSSYSAPHRFWVNLPHIPRPVALRPWNGAHVGTVTRLCWSKVPGAIAYQVWVDKHTPAVVSGQCERISASAGIHRWRVAAVIRSATRYVGPYSSAAWFMSEPGYAPPNVESHQHQAGTKRNHHAVAAVVPTAVPAVQPTLAARAAPTVIPTAVPVYRQPTAAPVYAAPTAPARVNALPTVPLSHVPPTAIRAYVAPTVAPQPVQLKPAPTAAPQPVQVQTAPTAVVHPVQVKPGATAKPCIPMYTC